MSGLGIRVERKGEFELSTNICWSMLGKRHSRCLLYRNGQCEAESRDDPFIATGRRLPL